ncbi:MAG TPA: hypothetical protein VHH53_04690, partial [Pseudonocardiaceae bacterium]|nr:hypothetical protein [Pseudonocardiaceae bacterium]
MGQRMGADPRGQHAHDLVGGAPAKPRAEERLGHHRHGALGRGSARPRRQPQQCGPDALHGGGHADYQRGRGSLFT